jgi:hypothetical protein
MSTTDAEQKVKKIIVSQPMTVVTVIVLKKYYPQLDAYLREKLKDMPAVNLTALAAGRHNMKGYNRIQVALKESGSDVPPQDYQGYQLRYPLVINSEVGHVLEGFFFKLV